MISEDERAGILAFYDVGPPLSTPEPGGGTANASEIVRTRSGTYFLKRRNPKYTALDGVRFDHCLMEHLEPLDVGTPLALRGPTGERWTELRGNIYELFPYRSGVAHDPNSEAQIAAAGCALARYHRAVRSFAPPPGKLWRRYRDPKRLRKTIRGMEKDLRRVLSFPDWAYLAATVEELDRGYPDALYDSLPHLVVHGDFHPGNVLYQNDEVVGIFDLDWATRQPRVLDLADGLFLFAGLRAAGPINATDIVSLTQTWMPSRERSRIFMESYQETEEIAPEEWEALLPTIQARWLCCRFEGQMKLPPECRTSYVVAGLLEPLRNLRELEALYG